MALCLRIDVGRLIEEKLLGILASFAARVQPGGAANKVVRIITGELSLHVWCKRQDEICQESRHQIHW